jgi:hypothetical protein
VKYVYGPVPSRRLGFSLGVDLVGISDANAEKYVNGLKGLGKLKEKEHETAKYLICNKN